MPGRAGATFRVSRVTGAAALAGLVCQVGAGMIRHADTETEWRVWPQQHRTRGQSLSVQMVEVIEQ